MSKELSYLLAALAAWRFTHLLTFEDGPWQLIARTRTWAEGFGQGLSCFYCLSMWTPLPFAWLMGESGAEISLLWAGGSGVVVLLHKLTSSERTAYWEEGERNDELLRKDETR